MKDYLDVNFIDKKSVFIDETVVIGKNVIIYENNRIEGNTVIGDNCIIKQGNYISNCVIGNDSEIVCSFLENSIVRDGVHLGPYTRLRPNSDVGNGCKIGNFVEIKNSILHDGVKAAHLSYIGDAEIGANCNIGCGSIFVNYDGKNKTHIKVGKNCFVGSNCNLIAPLNIENNTYICAGTTVTDDTQAEDFVIGRVKPTVKPKRAGNYLKKLEE
ncbi:MAG: DapH/DapD/GlmU-related protein [Clostridia bacterium]